MKLVRCVAGMALVLVAALTVAFWTVGCEEAKGTRALVVDPSFVDLTAGTVTNAFTQTFTVSEDSLQDLSLPLEWQVSDPSLGRISFSGGNSAAYTRSNKSGDNSIIVRDQLGAEGIAAIRQ